MSGPIRKRYHDDMSRKSLTTHVSWFHSIVYTCERRAVGGRSVARTGVRATSRRVKTFSELARMGLSGRRDVRGPVSAVKGIVRDR